MNLSNLRSPYNMSDDGKPSNRGRAVYPYVSIKEALSIFSRIYYEEEGIDAMDNRGEEDFLEDFAHSAEGFSLSEEAVLSNIKDMLENLELVPIALNNTHKRYSNKWVFNIVARTVLVIQTRSTDRAFKRRKTKKPENTPTPGSIRSCCKNGVLPSNFIP